MGFKPGQRLIDKGRHKGQELIDEARQKDRQRDAQRKQAEAEAQRAAADAELQREAERRAAAEKEKAAADAARAAADAARRQEEEARLAAEAERDALEKRLAAAHLQLSERTLDPWVLLPPANEAEAWEARAAAEAAVRHAADVARRARLFDVFLSHTGTDKKTALWLFVALRVCGLAVYFDVSAIRGPLDDDLKAGLAGSRVLLAWLSPQYFSKEYPCLELLSFAAQRGYGAVCPFISAGLDVPQLRESGPLVDPSVFPKSLQHSTTAAAPASEPGIDEDNDNNNSNSSLSAAGAAAVDSGAAAAPPDAAGTDETADLSAASASSSAAAEAMVSSRVALGSTVAQDRVSHAAKDVQSNAFLDGAVFADVAQWLASTLTLATVGGDEQTNTLCQNLTVGLEGGRAEDLADVVTMTVKRTLREVNDDLSLLTPDLLDRTASRARGAFEGLTGGSGD